MKIFGEEEILNYLRNKYFSIEQEIINEPKNQLLNVNESDYIRYLISKYSIGSLEIFWDDITVSEQEKMIPASHFPGNYNVYEGKSYPKQVVTYNIPFNNNPALLRLIPKTRIIWSMDVNITDNEIKFEIINWSDKPEEIQREANNNIRRIKDQAENLIKDISDWNKSLEIEIGTIFRKRKATLLKQSDTLSQLGVPVKKTEKVSDTFSIPIEKKKPIINKPKSSDEPFAPEPSLDQSNYESILRICSDMGKEMERHPSVYYQKDEETLRDHFIMQLSPHFQSVSGETFNKEGKTDILIRHNGGNVFVAECKYWSGPKSLISAIDQLLSYLTWRDSKTAILFFVNNKDFGSVLDKIGTNIKEHDCYIKTDYIKEDGLFRFIFHLPGDETRSLQLSIIAFHFPEQ